MLTATRGRTAPRRDGCMGRRYFDCLRWISAFVAQTAYWRTSWTMRSRPWPKRLAALQALQRNTYRGCNSDVHRLTTSHSGAQRVPSSDSSGDGASRPGNSNGGGPSRRADSNGGGPSKLDDANNDSHASGDASRRVQLSSACFLLPIARPSEQPGSMVLPRARIRPQRVSKQS